MPLDLNNTEVKISSDRMEASLQFTDVSALPGLSLESLKAYLAQQRVTQGIDQTVLQGIARAPKIKVPYAVAVGQPAQDGSHEQIRYSFNADAIASTGDAESNDSIDFRNIKNFNNTQAGTVVAEKSAAVDGKPGFDVTGEVLKARDGKQITIRIGRGVTLSDDGMRAIAEVDGHACLVADRISVLNTVDVPAHVDYSIGNISFIGNVNIRGGVMPGFTVDARGDININDNVEKANIKCGGNLAIRGIVFGQGDSQIEVLGDATIGAVDQAEIAVHGSLKVNNYITHCKVNVGQELEVISKKGKIIGGELRAFQGITAPFIGNAMATMTKLTVGTNPFVSNVLITLQAQHDDVENKQGQLVNALRGILAEKPVTGDYPEATKLLLAKLQQAKSQLEPVLAALKLQIEEAQTHTSEFKAAKIRVSEIIYPGVVINFRDRIQYKTMDEAQHCCFYEEAAEIRTGPF